MRTPGISDTPLGPFDSWPVTLHTIADMVLRSSAPMCVWWGPTLINIYNDAHAALIAHRHPAAFGQPAHEVWADAWDTLGPIADAVIKQCESPPSAHLSLEVPLTWSCSPILDETGGVGGVFCVQTPDVLADRERQELENARARLEGILAAGEVGTWSLNLRTGRLESDRNVASFHGLGESEILLRGPAAFMERMHPDDGPLVEAAITRSHDTLARFEPTYRILSPDGAVRWIANRGRVRLGADGEPLSIDGVALDITERHLAEERRRQSEERLLFATRAAELGIIEWNAVTDTVVWENQRTYEIFGLAPDEEPLNRRRMCESGLLHPHDTDKLDLALRAATVSGGPFKMVVRYRRPTDHAWRWLEFAGGLKTTPDGKPLRVVCVLADITERKRVESERATVLHAERTARTEAERVSRMKDEFLATLSHELRTPLNAILGWSDLLRSGTLDAMAQRQAIDTIDRNARVQTRLIEDLLDMSRIISGKVVLDVQPLDLAEIIDAAVESASPAAMTKGVRLSKVIERGLDLVKGDSARLQQVVWNLLSNAIKFTPVGGNIRVSLSRNDTHAEITVQDSGAGIDGHFVDYVFDRFAQADAAHTRRHGGLGLGLSIVKHLVEMHGGLVTAKSDGAGRGATFVVALPMGEEGLGAGVYETETTVASSSRKAPDVGKLTGLKVLVVDDEADARELMKHVLETREAKVVTAGSAASGLELVERYRPDVVLSDIGMPGVDGYDFIRQVRALGATRGGGVPAIAVTAFARSEDRERALSAGYQSHLAKPMQINDLIAAIANIACGAPTDRAT